LPQSGLAFHPAGWEAVVVCSHALTTGWPNGSDRMSAIPLISIVDDDDSVREAVLGLVTSLGYAAVDFRTAAGFLESADRRRTSCLIADVCMPGMGGLELHQHLVRCGTPIPTLLMTAHADGPVRARALKAGVRFYMSKPLGPEALLVCIRVALAG
jgi:FixJ family two-component response regulator